MARTDTTDKRILHMLTPLKQMSPFDVNMALDAGYDATIPYTNVTLEEVSPLVQDAMFSRPPKLAMRTGMFFGGKNALTALDMIEAAKAAMFPPFRISLFADPAGSFTTAAAMVACVEHVLNNRKNTPSSAENTGLHGLHVAVFGATGVVGFSAGVIAALEGAIVTLVGHDGLRRVAEAAAEIRKRFKVDVNAADGSDDGKKAAILATAEVVLSAARAGVQVLSKAQIAAAKSLRLVADVNAVPPPGIEGLDPKANGEPIPGTGVLGIGALAIGNIKYQTEAGLFRRMVESDKAVCFDFRDAFALARELNG
jgi:methylene-tetrahydromethanopterin dehydrogenase